MKKHFIKSWSARVFNGVDFVPIKLASKSFAVFESSTAFLICSKDAARALYMRFAVIVVSLA